MSSEPEEKSPDLSLGVASARVPEGGMLDGHVGEDAVLLVRSGGRLYAIGGTCSHYGAPLSEGLVVGDTVRCPWHHACFNLTNGQALRPPALADVPAWRVEEEAGMIHVREKLPAPARPKLAAAGLPESVVIVGGGAAGIMAAQTLRDEGYAGPVIMLSADRDPPYDRPVLSKDYLAGKAPQDWVPLHAPDFYAAQQIELRQDARVVAIDGSARSLRLANDENLKFGALIIATGATPATLDIPGADLPHVHLLRSLADCNALIAALGSVKHCVVVGASFIGLEVAAALRQRDIDVHVVAPDRIPMARIMGEAIGSRVLALHQARGVVFHLETRPSAITATAVKLANGEDIAADLVVVGIGVRPAVALAETAGLTVDRGICVDAYLETNIKGIFAAGDVARWPDPRSGAMIRVEHWVLAERMGQTAARNILGRRERFDAVPFFWSQHYDTSLRYVGHADRWDEIRIDGDVATQDFCASFWEGGQRRAVVTLDRDRAALAAEVDLETQAARKSES